MKKNTKTAPTPPAPKAKESKHVEPKSADTSTPTKPKREPATKTGETKKPRASGLNAAAQVLAKSKGPMTCGDLTKRIMDLGLWKTGGKTPSATINAAILREIKAKGKDSRFKRAGRGLFAATKSA